MPEIFMDETDFLGNEKVRAYLSKIVQNHRISHSYIFSGEEGLGKNMMAFHFAARLLCREDNKPCGKCGSCKKILSSNHPDIVYLDVPDAAGMGIDLVRDKVLETLKIRPFQSEYKVYIINDAHKLTLQAQNALLKSIEEPPEYAVFILVTSNVNSMLDTIKSRCIKLKFAPVKKEELANWIAHRSSLSKEWNQVVSAFAAGRPGKAVSLISSSDFRDRFDRNIRFLKNINICDVGDIISFTEIGKREEILELLDIIRLWYKDILLIKVTKDEKSLVFQGESASLRKLSREYDLVKLGNIFDSLDRTLDRIYSNVNAGLSLELMLLGLKA